MTTRTGQIVGATLGLAFIGLGAAGLRPPAQAEASASVEQLPTPADLAALEPASEPDDPEDTPSAAANLAAERESWSTRERELLTRIDQLEAELTTQRTLRESREQEWLEFVQLIQALPVSGTPDSPAFLEPEPETPAPPAESTDAEQQRAAAAAAEAEAEAAATRRAAELLIDLRALLIAEQVVALDFLAIGRVQDGWTGPVVVRLLDDWNRPMGTLAAERLRLEVSRAGRTVTLVLEEGFESHGGVPVPFGAPATPGARRGGVRRIDVPHVDPGPWIEAFPELIDPAAEEPIVDDGKWNLGYVRTRLNDLLRTDTTAGHWRLRGLGGVMSGVLRDVHLVQLSDDARVVRRLFADHLRLQQHEEGILLRLDEGVQERGGRTSPFLEGRYRIYLPRAKAQDWVDAKLPGLSPAASERVDDEE